MPIFTMRLIALLFVSFVFGCSAGNITPVRLCDALARVKSGEHLQLVVSGVIVSGSEIQVLYDPDEVVCRENVQPATWVEFAPNADIAQLNRVLSREGKARVVVVGVLSGPRVVNDGGSGDPSLQARARATYRRYGHLNTFRTQLLVERVLSAKPELSTLEADWNAIPMSSTPIVSAALAPTYPELARAASISGDVKLRITVAAGIVAEVEALSGDRLLSEYAIANVKTWRFAAKTVGVVETTFSYRLERRRPNENLNPRIEMVLPERVAITAAAEDW